MCPNCGQPEWHEWLDEACPDCGCGAGGMSRIASVAKAAPTTFDHPQKTYVTTIEFGRD